MRKTRASRLIHESRWGGRIDLLLLLLERRLGAGRQFDLSLEDNQGQLLGLCAVGLRGGDDASHRRGVVAAAGYGLSTDPAADPAATTTA